MLASFVQEFTSHKSWVFEEVSKKVNEGRAVDMIHIDFSKAFDEVRHGRLVQRLKHVKRCSVRRPILLGIYGVKSKDCRSYDAE